MNTVIRRFERARATALLDKSNDGLPCTRPPLNWADLFYMGDLGLARVSKGCHRKFRGHNFESCVTNFDEISFFSLRSRYGKFRGFHPSYIIRSVSDLQNPTATQSHTHSHRRAQRTEAPDSAQHTL